MKLKAIFALLLLSVFIVGCNSNKNRGVELNLRSISFTADITYYNENYSADCVIDGDGAFTANMTSPENLCGLTFEISGNDCNLKYNGLNIKNAQNFLPENFSVTLVRGILADAQNRPIEQNDKNYSVSGEIKDRAYSLCVAPTGLPISLKVPDCGLAVEFKNISLINNEKTEEF